MHSEIMISVKGLSYKKILHDVSFQVMRGGIFAVVGHNGAGKTTLFKVLLGILRSSFGGLNPKFKIGYLPEIVEFPAYLTARDILRIDDMIYPVDKETNELIEQNLPLGIPMTRRISTMSKGEKKKIAIYLALRHSPEILLLDEPTDGMDPLARIRMRTILQALSKKGTTIMVCSHVLTELERLATDVIVMKRGRVVRERLNLEDVAESRFKISVKDTSKLENQLSELLKIRQGEVSIEDDGVLVRDRSLLPGIIKILIDNDNFRGVQNASVSFEELYLQVENG